MSDGSALPWRCLPGARGSLVKESGGDDVMIKETAEMIKEMAEMIKEMAHAERALELLCAPVLEMCQFQVSRFH